MLLPFEKAAKFDWSYKRYLLEIPHKYSWVSLILLPTRKAKPFDILFLSSDLSTDVSSSLGEISTNS